MTRDETRLLLALVAAGTRNWAPTSVDVDLWHGLLDGVNHTDAQAATVAVMRRSVYRPTPAEVLEQTRRQRADRLERAPYVVPAADPDDVLAYLDALRSGTARQADGLKPRHVQRAITRTFPSPPPPDYRAGNRRRPALRGAPQRTLDTTTDAPTTAEGATA